jgi:hypothetical protein
MTIKDFWKIIILSFYSRELYIVIGRKWKHWGLGFLFRLSLLVTSVVSLMLLLFLFSFDIKDSSVMAVLDQIPEMRIENNKAVLVDENIKLPLKIKLPDIVQDIVIIDLSISDADKYQQNVIVFTSDRLSLNFKGMDPIAASYEELNMKHINTNSLIDLLGEIKGKSLGIILILGVPVGALLFFCITLLKSLFYASVASVFIRFSNKSLDFKQLTRLSVISNAPAIIGSAVLIILLFNTPIAGLLAPITDSLYLLYFIFAVISAKR